MRLAFALLAASVAPVFAQTVPPPDPAPKLPQAIDPLLTLPVAQLSPQQIAGMQQRLSDWAQLDRYRAENLALPPAGPDRVVFFGDSITDSWSHRPDAIFFPGKPYLNRGISGETTGQMLLRFQQDVVALHPAAVVILGGINDIAGNAGESTLSMIEDNIRSMVSIAHSNHIRVILSSVLPAIDFPWRPGLHPAEKVRDLDLWLRQYAASHSCTYLDYHSAMSDADGGMKPGLSRDNVHPTAAGYAIMAPLAQAAITQALRQPAP